MKGGHTQPGTHTAARWHPAAPVLGSGRKEKGGAMFGEAWFTDPATAGWLLLAAIGLLVLLALSSRMNAGAFGGDPDTFMAEEPDDVRPDGAYGLDPDEVEDEDRR